jgi:hypothetical protein
MLAYIERRAVVSTRSNCTEYRPTKTRLAMAVITKCAEVAFWAKMMFAPDQIYFIIWKGRHNCRFQRSSGVFWRMSRQNAAGQWPGGLGREASQSLPNCKGLEGIEDWKEVWGRRFATPDQQSIPSGRTLTFKQRIGIGPVLLHQLVVDSKQKEWRGPLPHE